jgi:hypothetical protein
MYDKIGFNTITFIINYWCSVGIFVLKQPRKAASVV